jgi:hypothetical protein
MLDNEDTPTTPRPSFPRDEHPSDDALSSSITTPAESQAPGAAQNSIADEPPAPDETSIDAHESSEPTKNETSEPTTTEPTPEPHDEP